MNKTLVTTSIKETYANEKSVLFLGEWCTTLNKSNDYSALDYEIVDDIICQHKTNDVIEYLDKLSDRILKSLAVQLNIRHGINHTDIFWKRLLVRWLHSFLHSQHYHWSLIKYVEKSYSIDKTIVIRDFEKLLESKTNMIDVDVDAWLHASFAYIIKYHTNINCQYIDYKLPHKSRKISPSRKFRYKILLTKIAHKLGLIADNGVFFIGSAMPIFDQARAEMACKQFPTTWLTNAYYHFEIADLPQDPELRKWSIDIGSTTDFERFIEEILVHRLPRDVLENYQILGSAIQQLPFPSQPKNIVTGDWPKSRSLLVRWIAEKLDELTATKLTIMQHGGNYGMDDYYPEKNDISISDMYLTWGWTNNESKIVPMFYHKKRHKVSAKATRRRLTLVALDIYLAPIKYNSFSQSRYKSFILNDLDQFIAALDKSVLVETWLRGFKNHTGIYNHYSKKYSQLRIDSSCGLKDSVESTVDSSKLFVMSYNTTFLQEVIASNIPVVTFWAPDLIPIRKEAEYCFNEMRAVGLHHDNPESAASHINSIWDDVDAWWNSHATQRARLLFCEQFARGPVDYNKLTDTLVESKV